MFVFDEMQKGKWESHPIITTVAIAQYSKIFTRCSSKQLFALILDKTIFTFLNNYQRMGHCLNQVYPQEKSHLKNLFVY